MNKTLTVRQYQQLIKDLRLILEEGRAQAEKAVARQLVQTYWQVGERIHQARINDNSEQGRSILVQLADEMAFPYRTLCYCHLFYQQYKEGPPGSALTWSHFRELMSVKDDNARAWYVSQTETRALSRDQLRQLIHKDGYQHHLKSKAPRRKPRVVRPDQATYVYRAIVEQVVDGDTLLVRIDLGFDTWRSQRLRLAQIDTPPLKEQEGQAARDYVHEVLAPCDWIMIRTNRVDMYARYIADVFYNPQEADKNKVFYEGHHLNADLVAKGLATVF